MRIVLGITGATGVILGIRLLDKLKALQIETQLVISSWAAENIKRETNFTLECIYELADKTYCNRDMAAAIASGSFLTDGMVIVPCSMKTAAGIANGYCDSLIMRAADVTLKEGRKLIIVPRETPFNVVHLENLLKLCRMGVGIMPFMPAFYHQPKAIDDLIHHFIGRILDQLSIEHNSNSRWA